MKKIVLTGGGTAGHVTPNIALIPELQKLGYEVSYIGSKDGIEKKLISGLNIPYYGISTGKFRRYLSLKNVSDPFRVVKGVFEARSVLKKIRPDIIFSKGGFVAVPVVTAADMLKIPAIIHESDITPGLANKMCIPRAKKVCCNFPETAKYLPEDKAVVTGTPIRPQLLEGDPERGRSIVGFDDKKPVVLVIGGSLGSVAINNAIRNGLTELLKKYQIIHICGRGHLDPHLNNLCGYVQFEFIENELPDFFAAADMIVSRAGANAICEIAALAKPNLLIPLPAEASRGDQLLNAASYERQGFSLVLQEKDATTEALMEKLDELYESREEYVRRMKGSAAGDPIETILGLIENTRAELSH